MAEQISFTVPSPYQAELADMARRQRMAEIMQQQAFQPMETFSYNGIQARTSPLTGLAKALQGYIAGKTQRDILQEQKALGEKYRTQSAEEGTQFMRALRGTPAVEGTEGVPEQKFIPTATDIEDNPRLLNDVNAQQRATMNMGQMPELTVPAQRGVPARAAVGPDLARALEMSMGSINPMVQSAGGALLAQMVKGPETAFGKIDPKDYTPESLRAFIATGGRDQSILDPRVKQEFIETTDTATGRTIKVPVNPYAPPKEGIVQPMGGFVGTLQQLGMLTPAMMQNPQVQQILSGYIGKETGQVTPVESQRLLIDLARLRDQAIRTQAETGMSAGVPSIPQSFNLFGAPQVNAPTVMNAPGAAPSAARGAIPATPTSQQGMGLPVDLSRTGLPLRTQRDIQKELVTGEVKKQLEAKEALPMQMAQGQDMLNLIDRMVGTVDKKGNVITEPHPGMSVVGSAIGRLGAVVPGSKGADFMSMYDQVKGQAFLEAVQKMRGSGAISEIEGQKAASAITRMNVAQSREEFTKAAREFQNSMRRGMQEAQRRAGGLSQGAQDALNAVMRR
jgi:Tfp pilus assembly protein PilP